MTLLLLTALACRHEGPPDPDTAAPDDTAAPPDLPVHYSLEAVVSGELPGQTDVLGAFVNPLTGVTYALDSGGTMLRYILDTYVVPTGDWCVGGTVDENGVCRGGIVWTSGRIESPATTVSMCLDRVSGELFLVKAGGENLEVVDVAMEGDDPYTYERALRNPRLPEVIAGAVNWTGPCDHDPNGDLLVLSSAPQQALAFLTVGDAPAVQSTVSLGFAPGALVVAGERIFVTDTTTPRIVVLDERTNRPVGVWPAPAPIVAFAAARTSGDTWAALGSEGVAHVTFSWEGLPTASLIAVDGDTHHVVADPGRGIAWALSTTPGGDVVSLLQGAEVRATWPVEGEGLALAEPSATGDVTVFSRPVGGGEVQFTTLAPVEDEQTEEPLRIFLFTTIEEPSDANMDEPCVGGANSFATELALVRNNAAVLAGYGVPVAMAITDNFAEKAEECGETAIYQELADYGFELGAMLHNRPCYHCTSGGAPYNPDLCTPDDPNYIAASSGAACFPDDPDYCAMGDYDCYSAFLAPRVDIADRNIPGGASFIVGADRHGMWRYDWIRLYREVERPSTGLTGFDLALFAGAWAFNNIDYDDPRGKNPSPWHVDRRTPAWHLADIDAWDQDSPTSNLLYLSGNNSATVKLAEQQQSGLYMLDFFEVASEVAYRPDDYEVQWQLLRSAVQNRKPGAINTWYFHIHDTGTLNLRDAADLPVLWDPDGDGEEPAVSAETMLADFVARIESRYGGTGAVQWAYPSEIRALDPQRP